MSFFYSNLNILKIFVFLSLLGCHNEKYRHIRYYTNWKGKNIKEEGLQDSIKEDFQVYYDGYVDKNGLANGECKFYLEDGSYFVKNYKNDTVNGNSFWFYENGVIKEKSFFKNGKLDGEVFLYDSLGNINSYKYFIEGELKFIVYYDLNKLIKSYDNSPFCFIDTIFQKSKNSDSVSLNFILSNPPYCSNKIVIGELDSTNKKYISKLDTFTVKENHFKAKFRFDNDNIEYYDVKYIIKSVIDTNFCICDEVILRINKIE